MKKILVFALLLSLSFASCTKSSFNVPGTSSQSNGDDNPNHSNGIGDDNPGGSNGNGSDDFNGVDDNPNNSNGNGDDD